MRRTIAALLLSFACAAALGGCRLASREGGGIGASAGGVGPGGADSADSLVAALNSFTEELLSRVDSASDRKAGAADAQGLLHFRKDELSRRIAAFKRGAQDAGSKARWLEAEVDNTDRVHRLQLKYADEASHDPVLKLRLEQLIADYDAMFKDR
jgi:hypothetical protein